MEKTMTKILVDHAISRRAELERLLTTSDLENIFRVNKRTIARLCRKRVLPPPLKVGQGNRWKASTIVAVLESLERQGHGNDESSMEVE
jgi:hypothetical protein